MKRKENAIKSGNSARLLYHGVLILLSLLIVGSFTATTSATAIASPPQQGLPTRPPSANATPTPGAPQEQPSTPSADTPSTPGADATPVLTSTLETTITPTQRTVPTARSGRSIDLSFEELGYDTRTLQSTEELASYSLYLPSNISLNETGNYVEIIIMHEPPVPDKLTTLRITFNRIPLAILTLTEENAGPTALRFELPASSFQLGRNRLDITLDTGERCGVRGATVSFSVVNSSYFHLEYDLQSYSPDLALYPTPFFEASFDTHMVYLVIPDSPSSAELSAAATIAAGLGQLSNGDAQLGAVLDSELTSVLKAQHHLIMIGKKGSNRNLDQLNLPLALDEETLTEEQGVIQELVSPWNPLRMILVVSALSDEGVRKASQALNRETRFLGMRGATSIVQDVLPIPVTERGASDIDITFSSLGYDDEVACGTAPLRSQFRFYMPLKWTMLEEAHLVLSFSHSEVIDTDNSSINIELNGVPIRSIVLDDSNATEGLVDVILPAWRISPDRNTLDITTELNVEDADKCLFINDCQVWAAIHSNSYIHLPFTVQDVQPTLGMFPYPFNSERNLDDLQLITSDEPQSAELDGMVKLAALLGNSVRGNAITLNAVTGDNVSEIARQEKQLIVMGRPTKNTTVQELNPWLPQPFEDNTDLLRPTIDSVVLVQDPERDAGLIQELNSPWNGSRMVLVLTGTTDEGLAMALRTLYNRYGELDGNVAVIEGPRDRLHNHETRSLMPTQQTQEPVRYGMDISRLSQLGEWWW